MGPDVRGVPAELIVDAEPASPEKLSLPDMAVAEEKILAWAYDQVLDGFFEEVTRERRREVEIRRKYARKSLEYLISESVKKLTRYKLESRETLRLAITQEERRLKELEERREALENQLQRAETLHPEPAQVVALCYLYPRPADVPSEETRQCGKRSRKPPCAFA